MEFNTKQITLTIIAIAVLATAGIIVFKNSGGGNRFEGLSGDMWVKCSNPGCGAEYQTDQAAFYKELEKKGPMAQALNCKKCNKTTALAALKCSKCGTVFFEGSAGREDYPDRCPKCKFSKIANDANGTK